MPINGGSQTLAFDPSPPGCRRKQPARIISTPQRDGPEAFSVEAHALQGLSRLRRPERS